MNDATSGEASRWKTFGERVIYDNPWVWLGQVDVELPDGERFWHHVVLLHRAAMMVLLDERERVLLLWRHRFVQDRWGWELPGGMIDEGEEPAETAARELEEETGYRAARVEHLITPDLPGAVVRPDPSRRRRRGRAGGSDLGWA